MKISPQRYIQVFCVVVVALGWARELRPSIAYSTADRAKADSLAMLKDSLALASESLLADETSAEADISESKVEDVPSQVAPVTSSDGPTFVPHRIYSVSGGFKKAFPDQNDVQLEAARRNGVKLVASRVDAEARKEELVYVGANPYFYVDNLRNSLPYLVPKAAVLVQDIGKAFYDSLQIKGIPLHKIIVSSVLRSKEDVAKLQLRNLNATTNSCHQYGTTVDICYNRYKTVEDPDGPARRLVRNDSLKWVLSEVLNDMRMQNRCYVKYEVKQGCFHLTVR